jgi:hypothetical protein
MKTPLTATLCAVAFLAFGCATHKPSDTSALQGTWTAPAAGAGDASPSLLIHGSSFEFRESDPHQWFKGTFTLREDVDPKQFVSVITNCANPGFVGLTAFAIYRLDDRALLMTGNAPGNPSVPAAFGAPDSLTIEFKK